MTAKRVLVASVALAAGYEVYTRLVRGIVEPVMPAAIPPGIPLLVFQGAACAYALGKWGS